MSGSVKVWIRAARLVACGASIVPVGIGGLLARAEGGAFSWVRWGVAVASGLLLHTAANLWNDYFDFVGGVDRADGAIGSGVLVHGELTPTAVWRAAWGCAVAAGLGGVWLAMQVGWGLLVLGAAGVLGAVAYCAGARSPKRCGWGELWVFAWMGLGMTEGGYLAQTGHFSWSACVAGAVLGVLVALLLFVANARDLDVDREAGVHTLAHWVDGCGRNALVVATVGMLAVAFALLAAFAATGLLPRGMLAGLGGVPVTIGIGCRIVQRRFDDSLVGLVGLLQLVVGAGCAAGLLLFPI